MNAILDVVKGFMQNWKMVGDKPNTKPRKRKRNK